MAPTTTSWNVNLLDPRLTAITEDAANRPSTFEQLVDIKDGNDKNLFPVPDRIITAEYSGYGPMERVWETNPFPSDDMVKGAEKTTSYRKYAKQVSFSEEIAEFDLYGVVNKAAGFAGKSYRLTRDIQVGQIYDNAFVTTYYSTRDAVALCATTHPSKGGGANRQNMLTVPASFGYDAVQQLLLIGRRQKDHRGYPDPQFNAGDTIKVVLHPEDEMTYYELFADLAQFKPTDDSNAVNVLKQANNWVSVINPYQSVAAAKKPWFLLNDSDKGIWLVDKWKLRTSTYTENGNKNLVYDARALWAYTIESWRGILGSGN